MSRTAYRPSSQTLVARIASVPFERGCEILDDPDPIEATKRFYRNDAFARTALAVASPSLAAAVAEWLDGKDPGEKARLRACSYALRMSSRTTPFGLFSGVARVECASDTSLLLDARGARTRTRSDMSVLAALIERTSATGAKRNIRYVSNDCTFVRGEKLHVIDVALGTGDRGLVEQRDVSLRNTSAVRFVRAMCNEPQTFDAIVVALAREFEATPEASTRLLEQLIGVGVVISELRASTSGDPVSQIATSLRRAGADLAAFDAAAEAFDAFDALPVFERGPSDYEQVAKASRAIDQSADYAVQVDLNLACAGALSHRILDDVAQVAELLTRSGRVFRMNRYRERFIDRYEGRERLVPLLELVDSTTGLGLPDTADLDAVTTPERDARLVYLMNDAFVRGMDEIELDDALCELVCPDHGDGRAASGFELGFRIAAADRSAIDDGEYRLVLTFASDRPAKTGARFASLLGASFQEQLGSVVRAAYHPDDLVAEFSFAPMASRTYNICVRPLFHAYEVRAGIGAPSESQVVSAADLYVGVADDDTFYLWSKSLGRRVVIAETHALGTAISAPNLCRFLAQIQIDGMRVPEIELGAAESLAYTPRLVRGRCVLRPRRWNLIGEALRSPERLEELRQTWRLPRFIYVVDGDQRLFIDLDSPIAAALIELHATALTVQIEEALPAPEDTWLKSSGGSHAAEFVANVTASEILSRTAAPASLVIDERPRFGFGSSWLYVKYYIGARFFDELLLRSLAPCLASFESEGLIDGWFFVRYADTRPHLRVRLRLTADADGGAVRALLTAHAESLLAARAIDRYAFDTYEPEFERYGGVGQIAEAERFFFADSRQCIEFLSEGHSSTNARVEAAASSLADWLAFAPRTRERVLRIFASAAAGKLPPFDREALRRMKARSPKAVPFSLDEILLEPNADRRMGAYTHMHCNRYGLDAEGERRVVRLVRSLALASSALTASR